MCRRTGATFGVTGVTFARTIETGCATAMMSMQINATCVAIAVICDRTFEMGTTKTLARTAETFAGTRKTCTRTVAICAQTGVMFATTVAIFERTVATCVTTAGNKSSFR
jgi:hypothetical protein